VIGQAIGEVLAFGVGVALSPLAIVALVVMLVARGGALHAWAFAGTWVLSLTLVSTLVLLLADGADASANGAPATWVSIVKIVVGLLLVLFGVRQWRGRVSDAAETEPPGWMRKLDNVTMSKTTGLAALFVVKPKNLLLTVGAGIAVAQVGVSPAAQVVGVAVFVALGTAGLAIPLAIHVLRPNRGRDLLTALRDWMVSENATIIAVLSLVIAAKLLGDALISLTS
jgi:Sap, sulfolipid-1-addressing protein